VSGVVWCVVFCYAVLCCVMLCCALWCSVVLYCVVPCRVVSCCVVLCCAVLSCVVLLLSWLVLSSLLFNCLCLALSSPFFSSLLFFLDFSFLCLASSSSRSGSRSGFRPLALSHITLSYFRPSVGRKTSTCLFVQQLRIPSSRDITSVV
jgi:hypothetical protein